MQETGSGRVRRADRRIRCIAATLHCRLWSTTDMILFADYGQSQAWFLSADYGQSQSWCLSANYGQSQAWFLSANYGLSQAWFLSLELKTQEKPGLKMAYICSCCPQFQRFPDVLFIFLMPWTYSPFSCPEFASRPCLSLVICVLGSGQPVNLCKGLNSGLC